MALLYEGWPKLSCVSIQRLRSASETRQAHSQKYTHLEKCGAMNRCPKCHRPAKFLINGICGYCQPPKKPSMFQPKPVSPWRSSFENSKAISARTCGNEWGVCQLNLKGHICKLRKNHADACRCACGQTKNMVMDIL